MPTDCLRGTITLCLLLPLAGCDRNNSFVSNKVAHDCKTGVEPKPIVANHTKYRGRSASEWREDLRSRGPNAPQSLLPGADGDIDALPVLLDLLFDNDEEVRVIAAVSIGLLGPKAAGSADSLRRALTDPCLRVKIQSAIALKKIGHVGLDSRRVLTRSIRDELGNIRVAVVEALWLVSEDVDLVVPLAREILRPRVAKECERADCCGAMDLIASIGPCARVTIPDIVQFCDKNKEYWNVRYYAFRALGAMGEAAKGEVGLIRMGLTDANPTVRVTAARSIWRITGDSRPELINVVREALSNSDSITTAEEAINTLSDFGPAAKAAAPDLMHLLRVAKDRYAPADDRIRVLAEKALKKVDPGFQEK